MIIFVGIQKVKTMKQNMKFITGSLLSLFIIFSCTSNTSNQDKKAVFEHHEISRPLPGESWGTGGFTLADYDQDGDMDITISRRSNQTVYWFEYQGPDKWKQHVVGKGDGDQLGATSLDIDGDGYPDLVMGRFWFKNPGNLEDNPDKEWKRFDYNGGLPEENHDIGSADFDQDGQQEVICYSQDAGNGTLRIYHTTEDSEWTYDDVSVNVNARVEDRDEKGIHGGFAPNGLGDLNGDGYPDIAMPCGWYENPAGKGDDWKLHSWNFTVGVYPNAYVTSMRSWITDIDSDGDNDVIYADCDVMNSNLWIILNQGDSFKRKKLEAPSEKRASYHSLAVADFNQDGLPDIFAGEQEDDNHLMKPESGVDERGLLYVQQDVEDAENPEFELQVIHKGNPGWHDTQAGDVDGDGDIDLVTKIWNADEGVYHADFWENKLN